MRQKDIIEPLVSTQWLDDHLADADLLILDASYHLPDTGRDAAAEYRDSHIPGALFLDLANLRDSTNPLPSTFPTAAQFEKYMSALGLKGRHHIILYDDAPSLSSARAWFILRHFGIERVSILDGGLTKWRAEGRAVDRGECKPQPALALAVTEKADVQLLADILANLESGGSQIVDARGPGRFSGEEPEIRPGLPSGHIPGSRNLPYARLLTSDGTWKGRTDIAQAFTDAGVNLGQPVITSCGSGITASALLFGLHLIGKRDIALYDGSWTEWASDPSTPKATGRA